MALPAAQNEMRFHRSGATVDGGTSLDPNDSLGSFRAGQECYLQSTLTSAMTQLGTLIDTAQINEVPVSPDENSVLLNSGAYVSAASLVSWYRIGYDPVGIGTDYGPQNNPLNALGNLDATDRVALQPGQFANQTRSIEFNGSASSEGAVSALVAPGIANAWSVLVWARTVTTAAGLSVIVNLSPAAGGGDSVGQILLERSGANLQVRVVDDTTVADQKERTYTGFFAINTWYSIVLTWDGTTLTLYKDGSVLAPSTAVEDDTISQVDAARRWRVGCRNVSFTTDEWDGQIHSVAIWDSVLSAAEVSAVHTFGDGPSPGPLDHVDKWMVFVTGANALEARRIKFHDNTTGEMHAEQPFGALGASGDTYRITSTTDLWNDGPSVTECATGLIDYRGIVFGNTTVETLQNLRFYLTRLDPKGIEYEIAASNQTLAGTNFPAIVDDVDLPDILTTGSAFFALTLQAFRQPYDFFTAHETPQGASSADVNLANASYLPMWVRRITPSLERGNRTAWLLVAEAASGSVSGAGPFRSAMVLFSQPVGFTPDFQVSFDRTPRTFGGAHLLAELLDLTTQVPIEGIPITFEITTGPGTIESEPQPIETDEDGLARAEYHSPEDDAQAGATVTVQARYGGD